MTDGGQGKSISALKEEIIRLGPWHIDVQVTPELSTRVSLEAREGYFAPSGEKEPMFIDPRDDWFWLMRQIYPEGLEGRTFLECACNCGAYCFWAKEIGASRCFGFDVREHWIEQARFLARNRTVASTEGVSFETMDLYDLPDRGMEPFDVTLFKGIFYHLPDPITGLKAAADLTKELLILNTAVRTDLPDGMLAMSKESRDPLMSGVYELNWIPTGPKVLTRILNWMGFSETWVVHWQRLRPPLNPERGDRFGRIMMVASRKEGFLEKFESVKKPQEPKSQRQEGRHDQPRRREGQRRPEELRQQRDRDKRIENLERQVHDRGRSLENSREELQRLRRERRRLQTRTVKLEHDLKSLQASWPWRLSEMLRRAKARLLRVGR